MMTTQERNGRCRRGLVRQAMMLIAWAGIVQLTMAQTPGGTSVTNAIMGISKYRTFAADTSRALVSFTVGAVPNFSIHTLASRTQLTNRDTVRIWIAYQNIGNTPANVTVKNIADKRYLQYPSLPAGATVSGDTLVWNISNVIAGQKDSVQFVGRITDTATAGSVVTSRAILQWANGTTSALQQLNVLALPNLAVTMIPSLSRVGSGRNIEYLFTVANSGTGSADGIVVIDSLSSTGSYVSATTAPASVSPDKRVVTWNAGSLLPSESRSFTLTVHTPPNLETDSIVAVATTSSTNIAGVLRNAVSTPIVILPPALVTIAAKDKYIFGGTIPGGAPVDSTLVTVAVKDSLGLDIPDGVPVSLTTSRGTFTGGVTAMTLPTVNGGVSFYFRSEYASTTFIVALIRAVAGVSVTSQAATTVTMFPGAVAGLVRDGLTTKPILGAVAEVRNSIDTLLGRDVTKSDGKFFIPLEKKLENFPYTLTISVRDKYGDTVRTTSLVDPTMFPHIPLLMKNTIAGRLQYANRDRFIPIPGVTVSLDSITRLQGSPRLEAKREFGRLFRVRSVLTDAAGRFRFDSLAAALYRIAVDSVRFPGYAGEVALSDTTEGTFTVNMNIDVRPDSSLFLALVGPARAYAGDTVKYVIHYANAGNMAHSTVVMRNTLPPFTKLDSVQRGAFTAMVYDTASHTVQWNVNTLPLNAADSVWMRLIIAKNIPENTRLNDTVWVSTDKIARQQSNMSTVVRTMPALFIRNEIASGKDSVLSGDSLHFTVVFGNTGTGIVRNVLIVDSLRGFYRSLVTPAFTARAYRDTLLSKDSLIAWRIDSLAAGSIDTLHLRVKTDPGVLTSTLLQTHAYFYMNDTVRDDSPRNITVSRNPGFAGYLELNKIGNKKTVEIGDIITYQVTVKNNSGFTMIGLNVTDRLPYSFKYYKSSARWNGKQVEPQLLSHATAMRWMLDTLRTGQTGAVTYQVVVGADALESDGINTVYASATLPPGVSIVAQPKQWQVTVKAGVFTERGLIIGKVFYDDDRNQYQSKGENGVKGVDLWMEDGTRITTGDDGKYSLPDVKPGQHVLRVDERTLPPGAKLIPGLARFAGDASSQFVRLTESGIARANFYLQRVMRDSLAQVIAKGTSFTLQRLTSPQFLYLHENFRPGSPHNTLTVSARFTYSGSTYLQRIILHDTIPEEMYYLNGSGEYNGRKIEPAIDGRELRWNLGRAGVISEGRLTYRVTARPPQSQEVVARVVSVLELMTADSISMTSDPLATQVIMRNVVYTEKNVLLSGRVFENGKSSVTENGTNRFREIVGRVQSSPFAEFIVLTYPDGMRAIGAADTAGRTLAAARAAELDKFIARRMGEDSVRVSVQSIFDYRLPGMAVLTIPGDVELRMQNYFYNGLVARDTGFVLTAPVRSTVEASEKAYCDTVKTIPGDNVLFRGVYLADPAVKHTSVILVDSLMRSIAIDEGSFTVNGVNVPLGSFSLRTVSPALSLNMKPKFRNADFSQIVSIDMTTLLKPGVNEIAFTGRVTEAGADSMVVNKMFVHTWNAFREETLIEANRTVFRIDRAPRPSTTTLEPPKQRIRVIEPVAFEEEVAKMETLKESIGKAIILEGVTFQQGNSTLTESAKTLLGRIVMTLKENPAIELEISGHTDNAGKAAGNRKLSLARAESVKSFLKGLGIAPQRLSAKGYGPDKPIASNKTADGRSKNRRVEFTRTK